MNISKSKDEKLNLHTRIVLSVYQTPKKLQISRALLKGPMTGEELSESTGASTSTVSKTLTEMHECGVVNKNRQGHFVYHSLTKLGVKLASFLL